MPRLNSPEQLQSLLPRTETAKKTVEQARKALRSVLDKTDSRLVVIVGPCSLHHPKSALSYAENLREKIVQCRDSLHIIMRAYIEKSRSKLNWKGFVYDPHCDGQGNLPLGLYQSRQLLLDINSLGVPTSMEFVNPLLAPYFLDLISWGAIGARSCESQFHREFAAQAGIPIGFKNTTHGDISAAINAIEMASQAQECAYINSQGMLTLCNAPGNPYCHLVLRGSHSSPNFDEKTLAESAKQLKERRLINTIMVDCSHGNAQKNPEQQARVLDALLPQIRRGKHHFFGIMLESHLNGGRQVLGSEPPRKDCSITDPCLSWKDTSHLLDKLSEAVIQSKDSMSVGLVG